MELIEIVDKNGNFTGQIMDKEKAALKLLQEVGLNEEKQSEGSYIYRVGNNNGLRLHVPSVMIVNSY